MGQSLLARRRLAHVVELALLRGIAARHAPAVRLLDVAHVGNVEVVLAQVLDQVAAERARHRDVHPYVAVATPDGFRHRGLARARRRLARDQRRGLAPEDRERGHIVLEEPLVLIVSDDHGDVGIHGAQRGRQLVERALAGLGLSAIGLGAPELRAGLRRDGAEPVLVRHHDAVRRERELTVALIVLRVGRPELRRQREHRGVRRRDAEDEVGHDRLLSPRASGRPGPSRGERPSGPLPVVPSGRGILGAAAVPECAGARSRARHSTIPSGRTRAR